MKTNTLLRKANKARYIVVYSVTHLDYDGMTSSLHITGAYDDDCAADSALKKLVNDRQIKHLKDHGAPYSSVQEVYRYFDRKFNGVKYIETLGWVVNDGSGFNKIRGQASIIKKKAGQEVLPAMFDGIGPFGLSSSDISSFFYSPDLEELK